VKRARFIAPARREFLAEVAYYNGKEPGLGARFAAAVEDATARAVAFPLTGSPLQRTHAEHSSKTFPLRLCIAPMKMESSSSRSPITLDVQTTGNLACKSANTLVRLDA
jgi:hypothetical protein